MFTIAVGMPGPLELIVLLAIVLILFGAGKLPKVLGQMGKGVKAFKEGLNQDLDETSVAMDVTPDEDTPLPIEEKSEAEAQVVTEEAEELTKDKADRA
jgi:sec-independent protein translocase protein TatA